MKLPTVTVRKDILEAWLRLSTYTKTQLARELGVTKGRVSQLLTDHAEPSARLIAKLLELTELPFEQLFEVRRAAASGRHPVARWRRRPPLTTMSTGAPLP